MRQRPDEQEERKTDSSSLGVKEKEQDRLQVRHIFETCWLWELRERRL